MASPTSRLERSAEKAALRVSPRGKEGHARRPFAAGKRPRDRGTLTSWLESHTSPVACKPTRYKLSDSANEQSLLAQNRRAFLLRKLHSLSGVVPVGAFMVFHLWTNAKALGGQEPFDAAVRDISHTPYLPILEWGTILLPLLFHAGYGVKL